MSSSLVYRWAVLDGWLEMWALKPRLLVFDAINFPALWTCGQDDELVIDNQGFWLRRTAKRCLNTERLSCVTRRKTKTASDGLAGQSECRIAVIPAHKHSRQRPAFFLDLNMLTHAGGI
jgi:hypothetical protein